MIVVFFLCCFLLGTGWAEESDTSQDNFKIPFITSAPKIDGKVDGIYESFAKKGNFFQLETGWGKPATEKTIAYFAHDDKNLYFAVKCFSSEPATIRSTLVNRDANVVVNSDWVVLFIDAFKTRRCGVFFGFNPFGIQMDGNRDDEMYALEFTWDAFWFSRGKIYDWGYFVECRIPFKSFRFPHDRDTQDWNVIVARFIASKGEMCTSAKVEPKIRGLLSQAESMKIGKVLKPGKNIEIIPALTGLKNENQSLKPEFGMSAKYGLSSDATLDLTYNPDYSHIEADKGQIDINQRYALYYDEKRPFFLESKDIFEMPMNLFYSRRISNPQWGAKFTGRFGSSSLGLITARDTASFEDLNDIGSGGEDSALVNAFRYKYKFKDSNHLGFFVSHKSWQGKKNLVVAGDTFWRWGNLAFNFQGAYSDMEDKSGNAVQATLGYNGKHLDLQSGYSHFSPDFDSQLGFIDRIDYRSYWLTAGYNFYPQKSYLRRVKPEIRFAKKDDYNDGILMDRELELRLSGQAFKDSNFDIRYNKGYEKFKGIGFNKKDFTFIYSINLNRNLMIALIGGIGDSINYFSETPYLGYSYSLSVHSNLHLFKRVSFTFDYTNYYFLDEPGGNVELKENVFRLKNTVLFSREISSRLIYEYNDYYGRNFLSLLLSYQLNPATVFYLGLSSEKIKYNSAYLGENFSLFFKFSYFFRL